ncbi:uncharacterized protein LOC133543190 [Nerophis ophidion]|uniref:uncharacterized protein LOC133543190 n=1 Tax=Nerophis ophidion TaxID=159077 RepID=UPI002AE03350|nr:uncharacterized protein LOC133543190 [Nerophis ophidion]
MQSKTLLIMAYIRLGFIFGIIAIMTSLPSAVVIGVIFIPASQAGIIPSWMEKYFPSFYNRQATENLNEIEKFRPLMKNVKQRLDIMDHQIAEATKEIERLGPIVDTLNKNATDETNAAVVFSAWLGDIGCTFKARNENRALVYKNVQINMGGGYDAKTGVFTVPIKGLYFVTLTCGTTSKKIYAWVAKNNQNRMVAVEISKKSKWRSATNSRVVELEVGDKLQVSLLVGCYIYGYNKESTFSVFLIKRT